MATAPDNNTVQTKVSAEHKRANHRSMLEQDETVRTFILKALKQREIAIEDGNFMDRRKAAG